MKTMSLMSFGANGVGLPTWLCSSTIPGISQRSPTSISS